MDKEIITCNTYTVINQIKLQEINQDNLLSFIPIMSNNKNIFIIEASSKYVLPHYDFYKSVYYRYFIL